jgi:hypothetical protein
MCHPTSRKNWQLWKQMWQNFVILSQLNKQPPEIQTALFLHSIGPHALKIYNGFNVSSNEQNLQTIIAKFDNFIIGELNDTYERYVFNNRKQENGETIEHYVGILRHLSSTCKFCDCFIDSLIRDRIVMGIHDDEARRTLLQQKHLTLTECIDICKGIEGTKNRMKTMSETEKIHSVS